MPLLYPHDGKIFTLMRVNQRRLRIEHYERHVESHKKLAN